MGNQPVLDKHLESSNCPARVRPLQYVYRMRTSLHHGRGTARACAVVWAWCDQCMRSRSDTTVRAASVAEAGGSARLPPELAREGSVRRLHSVDKRRAVQILHHKHMPARASFAERCKLNRPPSALCSAGRGMPDGGRPYGVRTTPSCAAHGVRTVLQPMPSAQRRCTGRDLSFLGAAEGLAQRTVRSARGAPPGCARDATTSAAPALQPPALRPLLTVAAM